MGRKKVWACLIQLRAQQHLNQTFRERKGT
jgi:hypothetical protein